MATHANLAGVQGVGPLSGSLYNANGSSSGDGLVHLPGTFALDGQFRVNPANQVGTEISLDIQTFVTLNSLGTATEVSAPPSGLVSWWKAEGDPSDALGANSGADHGVPFGPGRVGQAFQFLPVDFFPYVEIPSSPSLQPAAVTVMAWVKNLGFPGVHNYPVSQGAYSCIAASYAFYTQLTGLRFYIYGASEVDSPVATDAQVWDGNWHLVTGTTTAPW